MGELCFEILKKIKKPKMIILNRLLLLSQLKIRNDREGLLKKNDRRGRGREYERKSNILVGYLQICSQVSYGFTTLLRVLLSIFFPIDPEGINSAR